MLFAEEVLTWPQVVNNLGGGLLFLLFWVGIFYFMSKE